MVTQIEKEKSSVNFQMKRRRFIKILASSMIGLGMTPHIGLSQSNGGNPVRWQGYTMGAVGQFSIHDSPAKAKKMIQVCFTEIRRLEKIFSLYDPYSEICLLNKTGVLNQPSPEWKSILQVVDHVHTETNGLFDPTIQSLWKLYSEHHQGGQNRDKGPSQQQIDEAKTLVRWKNVHWDKTRVALEQSGMEISLNGIAQGFITDHITEILKNEGFEHVLVELGETRAIGCHPSNRPWNLAVKSVNGSTVHEIVHVNNQALATSFRDGSSIDLDGRFNHVINPLTGRCDQSRWRGVSVVAPTATEADGFSTALLFADSKLTQQLNEKPSKIHVILQS